MPKSELPDLAYFSAGAGPVSSVLATLIKAAGFKNINGAVDSRPAVELWIAPPGEPKQEISPPGAGPKQLYETGSLITIVVGQAQLPVTAMFKASGTFDGETIRGDLYDAGFRNVYGADGKDLVKEVWVSPVEFQAAPAGKPSIVLYDTRSLITLVARSRRAKGKGHNRPGHGRGEGPRRSKRVKGKKRQPSRPGKGKATRPRRSAKLRKK